MHFLNRIAFRAAGAVIVLAAAANSRAALVTNFQSAGTLRGYNEVPPTASPATGAADVNDNSDPASPGFGLHYSLTFSGLSSPATGGDIRETVGPVLFTFGVPAATSGALSGTLTEADFHPDPAHGINTFGDAVNAIGTNQTLLHLRSMAYPNGEIAAQLHVPEPGTPALMGIGAFALLARRRRNGS